MLKNQQTMLPQKTSAATIAAIVFAGTMLFGMGCNPKSKTTGSAAPPPADAAAQQQKAIESVRNNPHIPQQQKDKILAQLEGKAKPNDPPQAPPTK